MPVKDCVFLLSFVVGLITGILFIAAFATNSWMSHEFGSSGLWKDCFHNESDPDTSKEESCEASARAEGPAWLEVTRTLMCVALIFVVLGMFGYNFFAAQPKSESFKEQLKLRVQEMSYFTAGILTLISCVLYGRDYYNYYNEKGLKNIKLGFCFYLSCAVSFSLTACAVAVAVNRDTGLKDAIKKKHQGWKKNKAKKEQSAQDRKKWLHNKTIPTPVQQKEAEHEMNVDDDVEVKESSLKKIVTPVHVVLAFSRLKRGVSRRQAREEAEWKLREAELQEARAAPDKPDTAEGKYKGIFTIDIDNQRHATPRPMSTRSVQDKNSVTFGPKHPVPDFNSMTYGESSESISSTRSSLNEDLRVTTSDGALLPNADRGRQGKLDPSSVEKANEGGEGKAQQIQKVRRSVTTMHGDSKSWTLEPNGRQPSKPRPKMRRHLTHAPHNQPQSPPLPSSNASPSVPLMSICTLPHAPHRQEELRPPAYEEVVGSTAASSDTRMPGPVLTEQSRIYQPYSGR